MGKQKPPLSLEFKMKAVQMHVEQQLGILAIAKELGVRHANVSRWVQQYRASGEAGLVDRRHDTDGRPRKSKPDAMTLEQEVEMLRAEVALLKKLAELKGRNVPHE